jgi:hypothetical protein
MAFLDTLIVLVAVYFVLATACSYAQEQIASLTRARGQTLYRGILNLVAGMPAVVGAIYAHPLVTSASDDESGKPVPPGQRAHPNDRTYRPSYLDARTFTLAFHDVIANTNVVSRLDQTTPVVYAATSIVSTPAAMMTALQSAAFGPPGAPPSAFAQSDLGRQLATLLLQAQGDYDGLLNATDAWFNRQMDRVSGWYKREAQFILIVLGVLITVLLNVDTLRIVGSLQSRPDVSNAIAAQISAAVSSAAPPSAPAAQGTPVPASQATPVLQTIETVSTGGFGSIFVPGIASGWSGNWHQNALHVIGLLITAFAAALGAPFWFDLLSGLVNVRLAGQKPSPPSSGAGGSST